ncbi:MAG: hypothetical protein A2516_07945 [Alphaproteobacteria bacterium RIFOXYD12_FULL_60_8]|nr:MAG: hypothetical protein A2516_07945 [Alphaproteobacteria bacterium RIFOXYD12_FULL_60_8]
MWRPALISVALHLLVILAAWFGLPDFFTPDPNLEEQAMIVDITNLQITDKTNLPPQVPQAPPKEEPKPEPPKPEPPKPEPPKPEPPKPEPPKPEPPAPKPPEPPAPKPDAVPPPPEPVKSDKPPPPPPPKPKEVKKDTKQDDLSSLLKSVEKLKEKTKSPPPSDQAPSEPDRQAFADQMAKAIKGSATNYVASQPLSVSEIDAIRSQVERCWNVPAGARYAEQLIVEVKVWFNPDGAVRDARINDPSNKMSDPFYRAAAESAQRAVVTCSPYTVPREKYESWKEVTLVFNPRDMVGR